MPKKVTLAAVDREIAKVIRALKGEVSRADATGRKAITLRLRKLSRLREQTQRTCTRTYSMWPVARSAKKRKK